MADLLQPTGYYRFADYCPHDYTSEDEEPGDGIHVGEEAEGYLICLDTPMQPPAPYEPASRGYVEVEGLITSDGIALQCVTCKMAVQMRQGQERWMQAHMEEHKK